MNGAKNQKDIFIWGKSDLPGDLRLDDFTEKAHEIWIDLISNMAKLNHKNPAFWFTNFSSRNPFVLTFIYDFSLLLCIKKEPALFKDYIFSMPSKAHAKLLKQLIIEIDFIDRKPDVIVNLNQKSGTNGRIPGFLSLPMKKIKSIVILSRDYWKIVIKPLILLYRNRLKVIRHTKEDFKKKEIWFVDTYALINESNNIQSDRYFTGLADEIEIRKDIQLLWIYTPFGTDNHQDISIKLDKTSRYWLHKEAFLKLKDYIVPALFPIFCQFLKYPDISCKHLGISLNILIKYYIYKDRFFEISVYGMLCIPFIKRLVQSGLNPKIFLGWFENQWMDRGLNFGLQKYSANTLRLGYQAFQPDNRHYNLYQIDSEINANVGTHEIVASGIAIERLQKYLGFKKSGIAIPAYRVHEGLHSNRNNSKLINKWNKKSKNLPLITLPMIHNQVILIKKRFQFGSQKLLDTKNNRIYVRNHPASKVKYDKFFLGNHYDVKIDDNPNIISSLNRASFVLTSASQTALEALAAGCPVLIIADRSHINYHSVPDFVFGICCRITYTDEEFVREYISLTKFWESQRKRNEMIRIMNLIRENCYPGIWNGHIDDFITNARDMTALLSVSS